MTLTPDPYNALERFKLNATMTGGVIWIVLSGGCTGWLILRVLIGGEQNQGDGILAGGALALGVFALLPGLLAWHWGKRSAGYDPSRDLKNPIWRIPQAVGIVCAIGYWILGARPLALVLGNVLDGSCGSGSGGCSEQMLGALYAALWTWLPGWLLYWASTRP